MRACAVRQFPFDTHLGREVDVLLGEGHEVDVVCMCRSGERPIERRGRLTIWRMPVRHKRSGLVRYLWEHAAFLVTAGVTVGALTVWRRFDLVQVNSPPDSVVLTALVPRLLGTPVLLDLVEATPEFFATRFGTTLRHPMVRLLAGVEQAAIRFAQHAITGTRQMRQRFVERGADPERIDVVLNSSDERFFDPSRHAPSEPANGAFTLICHGSIERRYGLDTVIRAVALLADEMPGLRFAVYGEGSDQEELEALAARLGVADRVRFNGFVPVDDLVSAIASADAGVVAVKRDPFRDLTHTNKMFDFVAMRRPGDRVMDPLGRRLLRRCGSRVLRVRRPQGSRPRDRCRRERFGAASGDGRARHRALRRLPMAAATHDLPADDRTAHDGRRGRARGSRPRRASLAWTVRAHPTLELQLRPRASGHRAAQHRHGGGAVTTRPRCPGRCRPPALPELCVGRSGEALPRVPSRHTGAAAPAVDRAGERPAARPPGARASPSPSRWRPLCFRHAM